MAQNYKCCCQANVQKLSVEEADNQVLQNIAKSAHYNTVSPSKYGNKFINCCKS
jgi:hypothetical protein